MTNTVKLAVLTSDLRKQVTLGQPTCLERRALAMLEELGLERARVEQPSPSAGEVLRQVSQVLKEVQRLNAAQARLADESRQQAKEQREWARQMEQWNAGQLAERPRRPTIQQPVVVDYGDIWAQLSRLAPIVERALAAPQPRPEREALIEAARNVIYRAGEYGLLTSPRTDLQVALLTLRAVLDPDEAKRPCSACGGTGVIVQLHGKGAERCSTYVTNTPCPACRPFRLTAPTEAPQ